MSARRYLGRDFIEMLLHGLGTAAGQDEARTDTALRIDCAEDIGRFRALLLGLQAPGFRVVPSAS